MIENPFLSIVCVTYNHEQYIARAIEGFLMQKTTFPVEILIGEDCSTDRTREICIEYQKKYPEKIKLFLREKNLGAMANHLSVIEECRGKYVANCEGDDYWTDPLKLQKQVDFLETHPDYSISSHNVLVVYEGTDKPSVQWTRKWARKSQGTGVTLEDILKDGGGASGSLVFRNRVFGDFPSWFRDQKGGDWSLQILCASKGKMKYFLEVMGVYRIHAGGAFAAAVDKTQKEQKDLIAYLYESMDRLIEALDAHFEHKYTKLLDISRDYNNLNAFSAYSRRGDILNAKKYAKRLLPVLSHFPVVIIVKVLAKLFVVYLLPSKAISNLLSFLKKQASHE